MVLLLHRTICAWGNGFFLAAGCTLEESGTCNLAKKLFVISFVLIAIGTFCVVMGWRAPDKMPVKINVVGPSEEMVEKAVKNYFENLPMEQKYKILSSRN